MESETLAAICTLPNDWHGAGAFLPRTSAPTIDPLDDGWWLQGYSRRRRRLPEFLPPVVKRTWHRLR